MCWIVAIAGWRDLDVVRDDVTAKNFDCYFPKFRERAVVNGKKIWREKFLFGRYFFISYSVDRWVKAFNVPSISRILMSDHLQPALVDDNQIQDLRRREVRGCIPVKEKFRRGDFVSIVEGAMRGMSGLVEMVGPKMIIFAHGIHVSVDECRVER